MNEKIMEIAHSVSKIPGAKRILRAFYYPYKKLWVIRHNKRFRKYSLEAMRCFDKCMRDNSIPYTLIFGSLLGAIREKGFIKHDLDIDVSVPISERTHVLYESLNKYSFDLKKRFIIGDGSLGCEETFEYKNTGVTIDIFFICPPINSLPYCCCWNLKGDSVTASESMRRFGGVIPRRIELPFTQKYIRVPFESIEVSIDENANQISEYTYGPSYMTPDPNYVVPTDHRVIWTEITATYQEF
jgi:hypothetical protein